MLLRRGGERGTARPEVLQSLLKTTERVVQEIDSVEYGLTDIQVGHHSLFSIGLSLALGSVVPVSLSAYCTVQK